MSHLAIAIPRLPSRNLEATRQFYTTMLNFQKVGDTYAEYLMLARDQIELHFFLFEELNELENYGMCYIRVHDIDGLHKELSAHLPSLPVPEVKPWRQKEMHVLDPDHNLILFGQGI